MRKTTKQQLFNIIESMEKIHTKLNSLIFRKNTDEFIGLLTEEQGAAIHIGNTIEQTEGKGTDAVALLEDLCEQIWECSQSHKSESGKGIIYQMIKTLLEIKKKIEAIPEQYDIVFLPYKASMWDCMESVWKATMEDTCCNCYVVPIPYYDKKADGSLGDMHYEGELFPEYVPVIHYDSYRLSDNHPEVIYFHNPYDQFNHVTSVHPEYYSKELRKHTDLLVYIPYYCTMGELAKGHETLIAYYTADLTVVQNEEIRTDLLRFNKISEEKIVALGSPKFDKMAALDRDEKETDTPRFLYNTSISSILENGEKVLDKIEGTFKIFENRNDVLLVWRPHPLLYTTLKSMREELAERYNKLVNYYINEKIGIYDTTPDINTSVACSDAYIGEVSSSVVPLAGITGKPIFITNDHILEQYALKDLVTLEFMDCVTEDNMIWFVTVKHHYLCQMDMDTGKIELLGKIPKTDDSHNISYMNIVKYQDKLIMMPYQVEGICEYDLANKQFCKYYFSREDVKLNFGRMVQYKNHLYLLPQDYSSIVRFNLDTKQMTYYSECISMMKSKMVKSYLWSPFVWGVCTYYNQLFLGSMWSNHVLIFDMNTEEYVVHQVGNADNLYRGITADDTYCWLIQQNSKAVIRWNRKTNEVVEYSEYPKGFAGGEVPFKNILKFDDMLYLIPFHASHMIKMNAYSGEAGFVNWKFLGNNTALNKAEKGYVHYHFGKKLSNKKMGMYQRSTHNYLEIEVESGETRKILCQLEEETISNQIEDKIKKQAIRNQNVPYAIIEKESDSLSGFIEYVKSGRHPKDAQKKAYEEIALNTGGNCGYQIHEYIKNRLK